MSETKDEITIRRSEAEDLDEIMPVYEAAKRFMRSRGNMTQWTGGYPSREVILRDINAGNHYVGLTADGKIAMVFTFIIGPDPTYTVIEGGEWLNNEPYGTIHRIASSGLVSGMLRGCVDFCFGVVDNIRIDTHADNLPMLSAIKRLGFTECGVIHIADGSPRTAFHKNA